jgi:hypothetical protein
VGQRAVNRPDDVKTVQRLLNLHLGRLPTLRALAVDGKCGARTEQAIVEFQRRVVGMAAPDGRVDPGGKTLAALNQSTRPTPPVGTWRVCFQHHGKTPELTSASRGTDQLYESTVTVAGPRSGTFRGSIFPNDLSVKGRIRDGQYDLYLGFHKRAGHTPSASDLVVRTNGFRAALVVNNDRPAPVLSDNAAKTTSDAIHVHNGYNSKRESDGCQTLHPADWPAFIRLFLDAYPALSDWMETSKYVGKRLGLLEVKP